MRHSPCGAAHKVRRERGCLLGNRNEGGCPPYALPSGTHVDGDFGHRCKLLPPIEVDRKVRPPRPGGHVPLGGLLRHDIAAASPETVTASLLDLEPSRSPSRRRPSARERRMAPSRRCRRRAYYIPHPQPTGDSGRRFLPGDRPPGLMRRERQAC
jgi:hypothetical protein